MQTNPIKEKLENLVEQTGDFLEQKMGERLEQSEKEAPILTGRPEKKIWYKIPLSKGICGDGSDYHIYLKKGTRNRLCIFFSGGGVAWDDYTAARPVTGGKVIAGKPNFYWNNLRPFTQIMNINMGITQTGHSWNPFDSWCFIIVTYATGDFHIGCQDYSYVDEEGNQSLVHFQGHRNFREAMKKAKEYFPNPKRILIAGDSAGAFAVPALTPEILDDFYPDCEDITCFSDSGLLVYDEWQRTVREIWGADERFWKPLTSDNIILDWYRSLVARYGNRIRYLFSCSVHDYLLSTFYNAVQIGEYFSDSRSQEIFFEQLKELVSEFKKLTPDFGIFLNNWKFLMPQMGVGGTVHTAVRKVYFHFKNDDKATMARWLFDAVNGNIYDVGRGFLDASTEEKRL